MSNFKVEPNKKLPSMYQIVRIGKGSLPNALTGFFTSPTEANRHIAKYEGAVNDKGNRSTGN